MRTIYLSTGGFLFRYVRHQPENKLLYNIIEEYYPQFIAKLREEGCSLPTYVQKEFEEYLKCGMLKQVFYVFNEGRVSTKKWTGLI